VDGTLTKPRQKISEDIKKFLGEARAKFPLGVVGGSDLCKIVEQLGDSLAEVQHSFDYIFSENGLVSFKGAQPLPIETIGTKLGEERLQDVINFCLEYISNVKLPVKRGTFVEYRKGMLNVSPIGRSCSQQEREEFIRVDAERKIRDTFVRELRKRFHDYGLTFSIGGQISIDVFPVGWDKTYCLRYLTNDFDTIHFFGDRTQPGENDYEIFSHDATIGHTVISPEHTKELVEALLGKL